MVDLPWTWLRQGHGSRVVIVDRPGAMIGEVGDAAVTAVPGAALSVTVADCAPVALLADGAVGVVHAGWRGVVAGVVPAAVAAVRSRSSGPVTAAIGPCIRPECYAFGDDDLAEVAGLFGDEVRGTTASGQAALDLPAAVMAALGAAGVDRVEDTGVCTACSPAHWSWRWERAAERQALVAWLET